ncbi:hypothetical protein ACFLYO_06720 [Chloroflexota bacterium]
MRMQVQLPKVEAEEYREPEECPYEDCDGQYFKAHGVNYPKINIPKLYEHQMVNLSFGDDD